MSIHPSEFPDPQAAVHHRTAVGKAPGGERSPRAAWGRLEALEHWLEQSWTGRLTGAACLLLLGYVFFFIGGNLQ